LKIARARLIEQEVSEEQIAEVEERVRALVDQAATDALAAPYPDPAVAAPTEFRP
jgi:TPP-dependent pyruvate/acetoin dehydrogenase alpha subunit